MKPVCLPDKYEIIGELGSGGMGVVYHARDRVLDREVALKVLSEQFAATPRFVQRFLTEARAAASLNHPNIVQIYEFGETGNGHFLAMELVRGNTLKAELKQIGRFSEGQTLALVLTACRTLAIAHRAGIVHRDVKPDNMMFNEHHEFKLVDLGLAKSLHEDISNTVTGQSMGTPHFISPEQIMGAKVIDQRADVYSLGATMYNLATGHVPFEGTSGAHIMSRHLNDPLPDPRNIAPDLGAGFCQVLGRMMAKDPADRYQDMASLERDLLVLMQGELPASTGPVPTAVQDTIFMSSPDLGPALPTPARVEFEAKSLERVTGHLAEFMGPLARVLVRKVAGQAADWEELSQELAAHIRLSEERKAFLKACARIAEGGATTAIETQVDISGAMTQPIAASGPNAAAMPALTLEEATVSRIVGLLSDRIGPVARVLVNREMKQARSLNDLTTTLAAAIPDPRDRQSFTAAVSLLL